MTAFADGDLNSGVGERHRPAESLPNSSFLNGAQLTTSLPSVLAAAASNLAVARSLLVISALQLLVLAVAALLAVARLLAAQREGETALLAARGATRSQLTRLTAAEVIPLSALVSVAGALAGIWLAGVLVTAGPLGRAGIRLAGQAGSWPDALGAAIVVAVIGRRLAARSRAQPQSGCRAGPGAAGRPGWRGWRGPALTLPWSCSRCWPAGNFATTPRRAITGRRGSIRCSRWLPRSRWPPEASPRCACFPWPPGLRTGWPPGAGGSRPRWPPGSSAGCQSARASAALLLIMAVATGTLALAQHASWLRSASDQAAFATGGDVQVNLPAPLDPGGAGAVTAAQGRDARDGGGGADPGESRRGDRARLRPGSPGRPAARR